MRAPEGGTSGWRASLRRIGSSFLGLAENRLQLAALELETEKLRLLDALLKLAIAFSVGLVGLLLGTFTLALYVWGVARYAGLLLMTVIFLAGAAFLIWRVREQMRKAPKPFEQTINEFKKDCACLTTDD
jgi:uncharacterized membrane protein YqjE